MIGQVVIIEKTEECSSYYGCLGITVTDKYYSVEPIIRVRIVENRHHRSSGLIFKRVKFI